LIRESTRDVQARSTVATAIADGDCWAAVRCFRTIDAKIRFLTRAYSLFDVDAFRLAATDVWTAEHAPVSVALAVRLFETSRPAWARTIPESWPDTITVFRGVVARNRRDARRRARGVSWTRTRADANRFCRFYVEHITANDAACIPFVATAHVKRRDVIAYFPRYLDAAETECIVNPARVADLTIERL
jgi:hypothetical protein